MRSARSQRSRSHRLSIHLILVTQKVWMRGVSPLQSIGSPANDLVCIVTGPTSGIGRETAMELARRGAHGECVIIVGLFPSISALSPSLCFSSHVYFFESQVSL